MLTVRLVVDSLYRLTQQNPQYLDMFQIIANFVRQTDNNNNNNNNNAYNEITTNGTNGVQA